MVLLLHRLCALKVSKITEPGYYADGDGLYLQVTTGDGGPAKSWLFRYSLNQKRREMGLGALATYSLAEARDLAKACRQSVNQGIDPIDARQAARAKTALDAAKSVTFKVCAEKYIASHKAAWKNKKHGAQWTATLETYAYPTIGDLPVQSIETGHISDILEPIWSTKAETAARVRGRIEVILDWAKVRGFRTGDNPARWRGHLDKLFPARSRVRKVKHHAALPYAELPAFMTLLRDENGVAARALEFLILTAARTSEVLELPHAEIKDDVWIVDASRMKAGREHRVPLCARALEIVAEMKRLYTEPYVFPGLKLNKPLSNMALLVLLERMGRSDLTTHGFRSTFKDWVSETTDYPSELSEMALAHAVEDKVEAAYRRGDLFNKRVALMRDWSKFCDGR
ncbi:MAG: integrase arm-type DNA-binding domain-containing protein [Alphaproteobacteria bacterium]|nr:integrase arm-type DNA-binding domain-containing protein [Alphaproteobacteria bacterium]